MLAAWAGYHLRTEVFPPEISPPENAQSDPALTQLKKIPLTDLQGHAHTLEEWPGKILVINFWATWCPPCKEEMPALSLSQRTFASNGVQFIGIAIDDPQQVERFGQELQVTYPLWIGSPAVLGLTAQLGNTAQALPFTLFIDRTGELRSVKLGRLSEAELRSRLDALTKI
ncbi:MAG TPA: TlpA disulfide reductase family protein [Rhodocyclaceae bacterium]|nr:TlpA disulfide reductase family protein [Rhodocyclaceae bacterium]